MCESCSLKNVLKIAHIMTVNNKFNICIKLLSHTYKSHASKRKSLIGM
jgi:hypothetical protein